MSEPDALLPPIENATFLTGATASGKTALGVRMARELGAEIISLDSIAIYRGMDIGSAKPTLAEREGIAHHLIDIVDPWEEYSIALYLKAASQAAREIRRRGKNVLFVGGTPLWLKGCLYGLFEGPAADSAFRLAMDALEKERPGALYERLQSVDPVSAARLHPNDRRRLIRALEVYEITGRPISEFQKQFDAPPKARGNRLLILTRPRAELYDRINRRVDAMREAGFLDEVRRLLQLERPLSRTALSGVGYRELIEVAEGRTEPDAAFEAIKISTRHFAKRQETWFRSFPDAEIITP